MSIRYYEQEIASLNSRLRAHKQRLKTLKKNKFKILKNYPDGTMLAFNKRFGRGPSHPYTYVALKVGGKWTYTGMDKHLHSHEDLIEWLSEGVREVYLVTGLMKL